MNFNRNLPTMLQTGVVLVRVVFDPLNQIQLDALSKVKDFKNLSQKSFTYKAPESYNVKPGDYVVVEGPDGDFKIVRAIKVGEPIDLNANYDYKFIVQKIDTRGYDACVAQETNIRAMLLAAEQQRQKEEVIESYKKAYPEGSQARKDLEAALEAGQKALTELGHDKA